MPTSDRVRADVILVKLLCLFVNLCRLARERSEVIWYKLMPR